MKRLLFNIFMIMFLSALTLQAQSGRKSGTDSHLSYHEEKPAIEIIVYDNTVKVANAPVGSFLEIYSVVGIKVKEIEMKQPSGEYYINLAKGYYIIRIADTVRKIALR